MYNNYYGLMKDGSFSDFDSSMTISNKYKWDYDFLKNDKIRIFNPENNDMICFFEISEVEEYFNYEFDDIKNNWDLMIEFVVSNISDVIVHHYKNAN